jgi:hypothetical protein
LNSEILTINELERKPLHCLIKKFFRECKHHPENISLFTLTQQSSPDQPECKMNQTNTEAPSHELPASPSPSHASDFAFESGVPPARYNTQN